MVAAAGPRHEYHVHVTAVGDPGQLRRQVVLVEESPPELCRLPQQVPLRYCVVYRYRLLV